MTMDVRPAYAIDRLEGQSNWQDWKFQVVIQLRSSGLMDAVEGKLQQPNEVSATASAQAITEYDQQKRKVEKIEFGAQQLLVSSTTSAVRQLINMCTSSKEIWDKLHSIYEQRAEQRQDRLFNEFFSIKTMHPDGVAKHVAQLEGTWRELQDETWKEDKVKLPESLFLNRILNTLPSEYFDFINAWESVPKEQRTKQTLLERLCVVELRLKERSNVTSSDATAFSAKKSFDKKWFKCFFCKKEGHAKSDCPEYKKWLAKKEKEKSTRKAQHQPKAKGDKESSHKESLIFACALSAGQNHEPSDWIVDSGASTHMCNSESAFRSLADNSTKINIADKSSVVSAGIGDIVVKVSSGKKTIKDALHVPSLAANLLSVGKMTSNNLTVIFTDEDCKVFQKENCSVVGEPDFIAPKVGDLYKVKMREEPISNSEVASVATADYRIWHRRLGHLNQSCMEKLKEVSTGVDFNCVDPNKCEECLLGKQTSKPGSRKRRKGQRATQKLQLVHSDLCGPMKVPTWNGARYLMMLTDDFTRKTFGYLLKTKDEAFLRFKEFKAKVENETECKIKTFRTDNGGEYCGHEFESFLKESGIAHQKTVPYTPEQGGVAERMNRTIIEKARCMLIDSGLNERFWGEAVYTAIYLKNRSPTVAVPNMSPEEAWSGTKVDLSHLRTFGSKAFLHIPKQLRKKFDRKSKQYIMVGYAENTKGYRLYDPEKPNQITIGIDVDFIENHEVGPERMENKEVLPMFAPALNPDGDEKYISNNEEHDVPENVTTENHGSESGTTDDNSWNEENTLTDESGSSADSLVDGDTSVDGDSSTVEVVEESPRRYPQRERKAKQFPDYVSYFCENSEPKSFQEAINSAQSNKWFNAMREELNSLKSNDTWVLVKRPENVNVVKCKWVFKIKNVVNEDPKFKARLVAKGFTQKYGVDYDETFAPVICKSSLRLLFALSAELKLTAHHFDVSSAFLNGDLAETIYMEQPDGFESKDNRDKVCKLRKALYGLKQSSRVWNVKVNDVLVRKLGYKKSKHESCVYYKIEKGKYVIIALHVDDFLVFSNSDREKNNLKAALQSEFDIKDLGVANHCLGLDIEQDEGTRINQKTFIKDLLAKFNMVDAKPAATPMENKLVLTKNKENVLPDVPYQSLIGSLMFLSVNTRPDISFACSYLSQFNTCYSMEHWHAAKRVLRYLKSTLDLGITYKKAETDIVGFADSEWGQNVVDSKSYSGYVFELSKGAVAREAKKQDCVSLSSTEAEYVAISQAAKEAIFLKGLLFELISFNRPITLFNDNQGAHKLVVNDVFHKRTKHIRVKYHFIRDVVSKNLIEVKYLSTDKMPADIFTKALPKAKHVFCINKMNLS